MLAWCAVVETFTYEMANFAPLDYWIAELEKFLENNPVFPSPEIEASVAAGMFTALIFRQPQHPMLPAWTQRVEHIVASCPDLSTRFLVGLNLLLYYSWWTAEFGKGRHLIEMLKPLACKEEMPPLPQIAWHATEAVYYWIVAENTVALRAVEEGLKFAETSGVHLWDFMLLAQSVWARVTANDLAGAEAALDKLRSILEDLARYYEGKGDLKKAIGLYQKGIALDPLVEEFYQKMMSLYHRLGCRAEAVAAYHRCSKTLAALLQTPPSQATHKLYREIIGAEKQQK